MLCEDLPHNFANWHTIAFLDFSGRMKLVFFKEIVLIANVKEKAVCPIRDHWGEDNGVLVRYVRE